MLTMKYWWRGRIDCKPTSGDEMYRVRHPLTPKKKKKEQEEFFKKGEFEI